MDTTETYNDYVRTYSCNDERIAKYVDDNVYNNKIHNDTTNIYKIQSYMHHTYVT